VALAGGLDCAEECRAECGVGNQQALKARRCRVCVIRFGNWNNNWKSWRGARNKSRHVDITRWLGRRIMLSARYHFFIMKRRPYGECGA